MKRWLKRYWLWITIGLAVLIGLGGPYSFYRLSLVAANPSLTEPIAVSIAPGERTASIANHLKQLGVIRSPWALQAYILLHGLRGKIQAGYYELSPADSAITNAKIIAHGIVVNKAFLVREGQTIKQIEDQAVSDWLRGAELPQALTETYDNDFLAQRPAGASLEGYLFPDTYVIAPSTTAHQLVQAMLDNFGQKVTPEIVAGFAKQGLSLHQGLTLASMIEEEVAHESDRPIVAQVFLKRLRVGMKLESSVTAFYGASLLNQSGVTEANAATVNSLYNTYKVAGLPPGPIANPGFSAMRAVINPAATDYLYFVSDKAGNTHFAKTYAEHQANVAKYH